MRKSECPVVEAINNELFEADCGLAGASVPGILKVAGFIGLILLFL